MHNLVIAGCGDGNMLVYDTNDGECLYGFGVMQKGEVRDIQITEDGARCVAIGDDYSPYMMNFSKWLNKSNNSDYFYILL